MFSSFLLSEFKLRKRSETKIIFKETERYGTWAAPNSLDVELRGSTVINIIAKRNGKKLYYVSLGSQIYSLAFRHKSADL